MHPKYRRALWCQTKMINRTLVRTKVVLALFAYYNDDSKTKLTAEKELMRSFSDVYNLYFLELELINYLTQFATLRQEEAQERAQAMHTTYVANPRFIQNRFAAQLFENRQLRHYLSEGKLSWESAHDMVDALYKQIVESDIYKDYMASPESDYEADKALWRRLFSQVLFGNEQLENALEELEVTLDAASWTTDMDVVMSYVVKTIKRFREENGADQPLLEMFDSEEEVQFAKQLLRQAIEHTDEYNKMVADCLQNWDPERIAFMDKVILCTALAELFSFPDIPAQVTLNEYLEIAREYSTDNSPQFVNGVLDEVVRRQRKENNMMKFASLKH